MIWSMIIVNDKKSIEVRGNIIVNDNKSIEIEGKIKANDKFLVAIYFL